MTGAPRLSRIVQVALKTQDHYPRTDEQKCNDLPEGRKPSVHLRRQDDVAQDRRADDGALPRDSESHGPGNQEEGHLQQLIKKKTDKACRDLVMVDQVAIAVFFLCTSFSA